MENYTGAKKKHDEWIISITNKLAKAERRSKMSIYKVPKKLVKLKENAYTPSIVSIGPFHHKNKELLAFEEHKWRYMLHLFMRMSETAQSTHEECATAILGLEGEVRRCYSEHIAFDAQELAEILLVDGCFILELFLRYLDIDNYEKEKVHENVLTLQRDLALLENQIPFVVLQILFDTITKKMPQPHSFSKQNMVTLALNFFKSALSLSNQAIESKAWILSGCDHLLDILHKCYFPTIVKSPETFDILELPMSDKIPRSRDLQRSGLRDCATNLLKEGICFAANTADASENLLDINFSPTGVVVMPPLHIQEAITETIFRNLIAFEQCGGTGSTSQHIASYVFLMRSLLHSSHDVEILHKEGIIKYDFSDGGGDEDVTSLFKSICEDVTSLFESICDGVVLKDSYFSDLCEDVNKYYYDARSMWRWSRLYLILEDSWRITKDKWRGYMLDLFSVYFKNPWTTLKVIAAVLLLIFTALQTGYAIRSYYK